MKNIELLPVTKAIQDQIQLAGEKLFSDTDIKVDIIDFDVITLQVRVEQAALKKNNLLNQAQLVARAGTLFSSLDKEIKIKYTALCYKPQLETLDHGWIHERMEALQICRNDLIQQIGVDKATLSELLSGNRGLTKFQKAAFYYYFLSYELNAKDVTLFAD